MTYLRIGFGDSWEWMGKDSLPSNMGTTEMSSLGKTTPDTEASKTEETLCSTVSPNLQFAVQHIHPTSPLTQGLQACMCEEMLLSHFHDFLGVSRSQLAMLA